MRFQLGNSLGNIYRSGKKYDYIFAFNWAIHSGISRVMFGPQLYLGSVNVLGGVITKRSTLYIYIYVSLYMINS